ncbi:MAG: glycosyltransferase family 39 protein [Bacteroidota bacterium]
MKNTIILIAFILAKFFIQYSLIDSGYDLHRDEYLHLDQAHHLAWGYTSVPPFTSWVSSLIYFLGNSIFWIKFFPALFGALTMFFVWQAIKTLNGSLFALILGATSVLFSVLLRLNTLYQPNTFDVLSWTAFYYVVIEYFKNDNPKWLYLGAIIFALGFLNKYNIIFLTAGLFPAILLTQHRTIFLKKHFYIAAFIGLLLILPNLIWQYVNGFPVIHHMRELAETQLVNVKRLDFFKSQLMFFIGSFFVIACSLFALVFYKQFIKQRAFFWSMIFTLAIFSFLNAKDYYAIGIYPIYLSFGAVFLENVLSKGWKRYLQPVAILIPILFFIPMYNLAFPNKTPEYMVKNQQWYRNTGQLRWEDGRDHKIPQDYADMLGWSELARKVDSACATLAQPNHTLVLCDNYGQAGAINYYTNNRLRAVSFNSDYINWFDLSMPYHNLIRIKEYEEADKEIAETGQYFTKSNLADSIANSFAREFRTKIYVFKGAKIDIRKRLIKEIAERKPQ